MYGDDAGEVFAFMAHLYSEDAETEAEALRSWLVSAWFTLHERFPTSTELNGQVADAYKFIREGPWIQDASPPNGLKVVK